ncbi:MAG: hypothetical protein A2Y55_10250 [Actinobacteria bacterium RBG_16_68_12]|nr:MAG: hypothetical protein A2Y55_10250 [Actinobacteria bacterium RBG_16_68_12]
MGLLAACALMGFASAFALAASASGTDTTVTTTEPPPPTTEPPPTEPAPPTEPPPAEPSPPSYPREPRIPGRVTIGHVPVGGLTSGQASQKVRSAFARSVVLIVSPTRKIRLAPGKVGARPNVRKAVSRARYSRPGARVPLDVSVSRARIRQYVERLGRELDRKPVDARLVLRGTKPRATPAVEGRHLKRLFGSRAIRVALKTNIRLPIHLAFDVLRPKVAEDSLGPAVVILRDSKKLFLYVDAKLVRWFRIATGQASYPTPVGDFEIVIKERNPWWNPPPSDWARGESPVPPGPGNPLGTRWMGLSARYIGIHGTPDAASIGYSASHGCIRMRISDAEWLFQRVKIGTPVFILSR